MIELLALLVVSAFSGAALFFQNRRTARLVAAERTWAKHQLDDERGRVNDLLNRLATRSLGEYQAFLPTIAEPGEEPRYFHDDFGLTSERVMDNG